MDISVTVKVISQSTTWKTWESPWTGSGPFSCSSRNEGAHTRFLVVNEFFEGYIKLSACFSLRGFFRSWRKRGSNKITGVPGRAWVVRF